MYNKPVENGSRPLRCKATMTDVAMSVYRQTYGHSHYWHADRQQGSLIQCSLQGQQ